MYIIIFFANKGEYPPCGAERGSGPPPGGNPGKGVSSTLQRGRYTLLYIQADDMYFGSEMTYWTNDPLISLNC